MESEPLVIRVLQLAILLHVILLLVVIAFEGGSTDHADDRGGGADSDRGADGGGGCVHVIATGSVPEIKLMVLSWVIKPVVYHVMTAIAWYRYRVPHLCLYLLPLLLVVVSGVDAAGNMFNGNSGGLVVLVKLFMVVLLMVMVALLVVKPLLMLLWMEEGMCW